MNLSFPTPELDPIPVERISAILACADAMDTISDGTGKPLQSIIDEVRRRIRVYKDGQIPFESVVDTLEMARAFLTEYSSSGQLRSDIPFSESISNTLCQALASYPIPLTRVYFEFYDELESHRLLRSTLFSYYKDTKKLGALTQKNRSYIQNADLIFGENGPQKVSNYAADASKSLREIETQLHLPSSGIYHDQAFRWFYIHEAKSTSFGDLTERLKETIAPEVSSLTLDGSTLGHHIIATLVQRCIDAKKPIPQKWLKYILRVAGDPRLPLTHKRFQKNWAKHSIEVIRKVKSALAKRDLEFFLDLLGEFANSEGGEIARMYPARRKFLDGLLNLENAIQDALLILSQSGIDYIMKRLDPDERKSFECTKLTKSSKEGQCAIYIELPKGHLIEGSHQSRLRLYRAEASFPTRLRDQRPNTIDYPEITQSDITFEANHNPNINWQFKVLKHLARNDYGVDINPEKTLSESDYNTMIQRYGVPS